MVKVKQGKRGSIEIILLLLFIIAVIIMLSIFYMLNIQINSYIYPIKQDIFYIVQNSIVSLNIEDLSYFKYNIDDNILKEKISFILQKNHKEAKVDDIKYNYNKNTIDIKIILTIKPIVLCNLLGKIRITLYDSIKLKNMEVIGN